MTALGAVRRALACTLTGALLVLALGGCVTVTGRRTAAAHSPRTPSDESVGLARPFPSLPAVALAPVPDGYDPSADASAAIDRALAAARRDGRPVLVDFGSSWCADCQAMAALIRTAGLHQVLARNYHLVTVDVGRFDHNLRLAERYVPVEVSGIPAVVELAPDGSLLQGDNEGRFADARTLGADQVADVLISWLYPRTRNDD
ncbi:co-chaperone YbbN [Streptacidiphilus sp. P02-A3a]|uniref:thioredoxin family protein n=1 Tax=Streptacidiphilus sp. P02-A3a TaxID=2704468 RepID=UPI0015FAF727|nr:thioredoxin family protein [Streptacidiphilus sp. P02-A3a]QMU73177.1 thioredoxin family protein [Streptacidiphilus sp. P02-A3a]